MSRRYRPVVTRPVPARTALDSAMPALLRRIYAAREVTSAEALDTGLAGLVPVGAFAGLGPAVARLLEARLRGERVLIVGDFDADGATSTALLMRGLAALGFPAVDYLVPNRFETGYGLGPEVVELATLRQPGLLITVDNGIASVEGVAAANRRGIDVIVTDHHLPGDQLPDACALVNPNLPGEPFPHKHLAGVGVAFYLLAALARCLAERGEVDRAAPRQITAWLDLVALGTVADVVPLDHNNRILVAQGLQRIRAGRCSPGVLALLRAGGRDPTRASAADLGFAAGPRLNAAGRLTDMSVGIACLLTDDPVTAARLAGELDALNRERRLLEARMREEAETLVEALPVAASAQLPPALTLYRPDWHQGVVGLIAARIRERHHRPVVAFAPDGQGRLKGSARSVPALHIRDTLERVAVTCPGLIEGFGGHAMAAGLALREGALDAFTEAFSAAAGERLEPSQLRGELLTDGELTADELSLETAEMLEAAGPWGAGFEEPSFQGRFEVLAAREVGSGHLRLTLATPGGAGRVGAIAFGCPVPWPLPGETVELVYRLQVNAWQGRREAQVLVEHLQPPGP
ncbi:MAG: single-stranded-DNA-specific exonuclease RecJ [Gammaproteobacteria bacterium]|nr:single-stranded-DNA-specific exonuclease RecJ [Gammaproteobacteria bacterium]